AFGVGQIKQAAEKVERLIGIKITVEIRLFRQVTDARFGGDVPRRMAEHLDVPSSWIQQAQQHLDGCRFAGAVRTEQTEDLAASDRGINIIDRLGFGPAPEVFEGFGQPPDDNHIRSRLWVAGGGWRGSFFKGDHTLEDPEKGALNIELRTSNIQHRTSNIKHPRSN